MLEIGCGRGDFLLAFRSAGMDCCGVDVSESSAELLQDVDFSKCDITSEPLPFEGDTFDVVYHKSLLEHLYDPNYLMEETYRVLKPGGIVIILTPDWISQMKVFYEDFTHSRPYDATALNDLLKIKGFSGVQTERFYQLPVLWRYPFLKIISRCLQLIMSTICARKLTKLTNIKFFRWSVELMVLGVGYK